MCTLDASVVIVGHGPLRDALERQAQALGVADRVALQGTVSQDALPEGTRKGLVLQSAPAALMVSCRFRRLLCQHGS
jgi:hypothetical protein